LEPYPPSVFSLPASLFLNPVPFYFYLWTYDFYPLFLLCTSSRRFMWVLDCSFWSCRCTTDAAFGLFFEKPDLFRIQRPFPTPSVEGTPGMPTRNWSPPFVSRLFPPIFHRSHSVSPCSTRHVLIFLFPRRPKCCSASSVFLPVLIYFIFVVIYEGFTSPLYVPPTGLLHPSADALSFLYLPLPPFHPPFPPPDNHQSFNFGHSPTFAWELFPVIIFARCPRP